MSDKKLLFFIPLLLSITLCIAQQILYQGVETDKSKQPTKHVSLVSVSQSQKYSSNYYI
jgi:hypothetical protein